VIDLAVALKLKGIASADALAETAGVASADAATASAQWVADGLAMETPRGLRLTPEGRVWVDGLLAEERAGIDAAAAEAAYERFCEHNGSFKQLVTDWQIKVVDGEQTLNDHTDAAYDQAIFARLHVLHEAALGVLHEVGTICPRLARYVGRFEKALANLDGGDQSWLAAPMKDSYHTVWFEYHEELILLCGRSRADEAAAGRGA
jgi:pyruvate,orthophosphate dikinase